MTDLSSVISSGAFSFLSKEIVSYAIQLYAIVNYADLPVTFLYFSMFLAMKFRCILIGAWKNFPLSGWKAFDKPFRSQNPVARLRASGLEVFYFLQ